MVCKPLSYCLEMPAIGPASMVSSTEKNQPVNSSLAGHRNPITTGYPRFDSRLLSSNGGSMFISNNLQSTTPWDQKSVPSITAGC